MLLYPQNECKKYFSNLFPSNNQPNLGFSLYFNMLTRSFVRNYPLQPQSLKNRYFISQRPRSEDKNAKIAVKLWNPSWARLHMPAYLTTYIILESTLCFASEYKVLDKDIVVWFIGIFNDIVSLPLLHNLIIFAILREKREQV